MSILIPLLIVLLGVFTQSLTGFGSGLVSMAFLPGLIGVRQAGPLVALVTGTLEVFLLIRFRSAFQLRNVWRMTMTSILGIPLGVWGLRQMNEDILMTVLGLVIAGYAIYALLNFRLPTLEHPAWAYAAGFIAGLLSGSYSIGGPPAIIYGTCRGWEPDEFKSNLQGFFLVNDSLTIISHALVGNLVPAVLNIYMFALPVIGLGIVAASLMDRWLSPAVFRKLALILLVVMGLRLAFFH